MIRELMVNGAKNIPANYAAKVDMVTGMGVQVDHKAGQVKFPDAATAEGIEMVAHEFIPEGIYASQTNFDDYDKMATEIKAGVLVKRVPLYAGELYGTDQYKDGDAQDLFKEKVFYIFVDNIDFFTEPPRCQNRNELRTCHNSAHFIHRQTAKVMPIRYNSQCGFDWSITPLRP